MSSFFTVPGSRAKRKRPTAPQAPKKRIAVNKLTPSTTHSKKDSSRKKSSARDESISGSDLESSGEDDIRHREAASDAAESSGSEGNKETAAERRLRLAERYLENVRQDVEEIGFDAAEIDRDRIALRLEENVAEAKGKVYKALALHLAFDKASHTFFKANSMAVTSVAIRAPFAYMVTKDMALQKWRIQELPGDQYPSKAKKQPKRLAPPRTRPELVAWVRGNYSRRNDKDYKRHTRHILTAAVSSDGKYVVTGGLDKLMIVYDAETLRTLKVFTQHRDAVTGLAFRRGTNQIYSCSRDRTVKVWSLDELAYVETLFGHQDEVVDVDALGQERCVTTGARDRTARLWKVAEETQLVYRSGSVDKKVRSSNNTQSSYLEGSIDRVTMIDDDLFVTGSDNGTIALWNVQKKKPMFTIPHAHGIGPQPIPAPQSSAKTPQTEMPSEPRPRWITALRAVPYSDVILSGSWDGYIRVWRLSDDKKQMQSAGVLGGSEIRAQSDLPNGHPPRDGDENPQWLVPGIVNDIAVFERGDNGRDGLCIVAAVAKEHRFGRWMDPKGAKNGGVVFEVPRISPKPLANGAHKK